MKDCFSASNKLTLQHLYLSSEANSIRYTVATNARPFDAEIFLLIC